MLDRANIPAGSIVLPPLEPISVVQIAGDNVTTKTRLIAAAERLLGERGIETTPLHEIATEAGQANNYAVQYHFEDREGLIRAVFSLRLSHMERRSRELIASAEKRKKTYDLTLLLQFVFLPIAEQVDDTGRHSYARFLLQYITRPSLDHALRHPLGSADDPVAFVFDRIIEILDRPRSDVMRRLYLQSLVFLGALIERDNALQYRRPTSSMEVMLSETLAMMTAALQLTPSRYRL